MRSRGKALSNLPIFLIFIFSLFLFTQSSIAERISVTNLKDDEPGSLREAIMKSNSTPGVDDEIVFRAGLTGTIHLTEGEMVITDDVSINGAGSNVIIDANNKSRIFHIYDGLDDKKHIVVSTSGLKFINGNNGAILNQEELSLASCEFENNTGLWGGAVNNLGIPEGNLFIDSCVFDKNTGNWVNDDNIFCFLADDIIFTEKSDCKCIPFNRLAIITEITNCTFSGNNATLDGGAIRNKFGIINKITNSTFSGNNAIARGGAIYNKESIIGGIINSTFTGNESPEGGAINNSGTIEITNSTFSGNKALAAAEDESEILDEFGGAIFNGGNGILNLINSTVSGNSAVEKGGAIYNDSYINISFTTIADNGANEGGGIFEEQESRTGTTNIRNSIVAFNTADSSGVNCNTDIATHSVETNNYSDDDSCRFDYGYADIDLGPLDDNGGPTKTMALLGGDPLNGASDNCSPLGYDGIPTGAAPNNDQRYTERPERVCDSGAYEAQPEALVEQPQYKALFSYFDLRNRESFVQVTNIDSLNTDVHVQIFDVSNNCGENNFFDSYTPSDTHVYKMRDIQTNDGNPSGVILPDGAYGFVSIVPVVPLSIIGNFRVIDDNGYEYRSVSVNPGGGRLGFFTGRAALNFNTKGNTTLSDVIGLAFHIDYEKAEVSATDIVNNYMPVDINIINEDEVIFSCRNVIFACTDQDNPMLGALLEEAGAASVAGFEYGINNAIPHSKGAELLCPGNNISDGVVTIERIAAGDSPEISFTGFIGLNNGNGRGSMDSWWFPNNTPLPPPC